MKSICTSFLFCLAVHCNIASAAPLTIANHGFEEPYLSGNLPPEYSGDVPPTAFPTGGAPTGWSSYGTVGGGASIGVLNPGVMAVEPLATFFPDGAPEGDNVALLFYNNYQGGPEFGLEQTLADTLQPRTTYTLTVEVGNIASGISTVAPYSGFGFFDIRGFPGYRIELTAGGQVIAQDNNTLLPGEGEFLTSTIQLNVADTHAQLNQPLGIRLINLNQQDLNEPGVTLEVDYDDVQLDASAYITADFDQDTDVDGRDFLTWQQGYGGGPLLSQGNADGDTDIDNDDLLIWEQTFGATPTPALSVIIPEPSTTALSLLGLFTVVPCRFRYIA